jgi:hypothetical protein
MRARGVMCIQVSMGGSKHLVTEGNKTLQFLHCSSGHCLRCEVPHTVVSSLEVYFSPF